MLEALLVRLIVSQIFMVLNFLILTPLKPPKKRNTLIIAISALLITFLNALLIIRFGILSVYVRIFPITIILPYFLLFLFLGQLQGRVLLFSIFTAELFGNIAITNGLLASYLLYGIDNAWIDTAARFITLSIATYILWKWVRPTFLRMVGVIKRGWWILDGVLLFSYALAYFIAFVPSSIFRRPEYFVHLYIGLGLSLFIYSVIFLLFTEISVKLETDRDRQLLSVQVNALANQSVAVDDARKQTAILRHDLRHLLRIVSEQVTQGNIEAAKEFLLHSEQRLEESILPVYCLNPVINAALSYYFNVAKQKGIRIEHSMDIPEKIAVDDKEFAIVLANAVENAIKACERVEPKEFRTIKITAKNTQNQLIIEIINPYSGHLRFDDLGFPEMIEKGHGVGMLSMAAFAKKNHAILDFNTSEHLFKFRLLIPQ